MEFSLGAMTTFGGNAVRLGSRWELMGPLEALSGWILFGLTTAFLFTIIREVWATEQWSCKPAANLKSSDISPSPEISPVNSACRPHGEVFRESSRGRATGFYRKLQQGWPSAEKFDERYFARSVFSLSHCLPDLFWAQSLGRSMRCDFSISRLSGTDASAPFQPSTAGCQNWRRCLKANFDSWKIFTPLEITIRNFASVAAYCCDFGCFVFGWAGLVFGWAGLVAGCAGTRLRSWPGIGLRRLRLRSWPGFGLRWLRLRCRSGTRLCRPGRARALRWLRLRSGLVYRRPIPIGLRRSGLSRRISARSGCTRLCVG